MAPTGLVSTQDDGSPLRPGHVSKHPHDLADEIGLRRTRFHDLRHAQASLQQAAVVALSATSKTPPATTRTGI